MKCQLMLRAIKRKYGERQLKKLQKKRHHKPVAISWKDVKHLGILYHCQSEKDLEEIKRFVDSLPDGMTVRTLGYSDIKEPEDYQIQPEPYRFFSRADLNWYGKPVSDGVRKFIQTPFDLLINLSPDVVIPLDYVLVQSHARLIAGVKTENQQHDIMIDTASAASKSYILEQIVYYMKMIKPR
ncbi:MAG: DUF6913 domain-containing protein [Bacteroidales bacterium]